MPANDFSEQLNSALQEFTDFNKKMFGNEEGVATALKGLERVLTANKDGFENILKGGKLLDKGFEELDETIGKMNKKTIGKDLKKALQDNIKAIQSTNKFVDKMTDSMQGYTTGLAKQIPIVGKVMAKGFEKMFSSPWLKKAMNSGMMKLFGGSGKAQKVLGGIGKLGGGAAGAGLAIITMIGKELFAQDAAMVSMTKNTGFLQKQTKRLMDITIKENRVLQSNGIYAQDRADAASALLSEFGNINQTSQRMTVQAARWTKAFGLGGQEVAKTMEILTRNVGLSEEGMDNFVENLGANAYRAGTSLSLVMREIANNSNFVALYSDQYGNNIKEAAIHAKTMGSGLGELGSQAEQFLDYETASLKIAKFNALTGANINVQHVQRLADQGKLVELNKLFTKELMKAGIHETHSAIMARAAADASGQTLVQMKLGFKAAKDGYVEFDENLKNVELQEQSMRDIQTIWQRISHTLRSIFTPYLEKAGEKLRERLIPALNIIQDIFKNKGLMGGMMELLKKAGHYIGQGIRAGFFDVKAIPDPTPIEKLSKKEQLKKITGTAGRFSELSTIGKPLTSPFAEPVVGAKGGIVNKPTLAIIGEAGPEAVVPLGGKGGLDMKGGIAHFRGGGAIIPVGARGAGLVGALAGSTGSMRDASDPFERRLRVQAVKDAAEAYRASMRDEDRKLFSEQEKNNKRFGRSVRGFSSGVRGFSSNIGTLIKGITGMGYQDLANSILGDKWGSRAGQVAGGARAYQQGGWRGLARQTVGQGGMFAEGGMFANAWGGNAGRMAGSYGEGGLRGAAGMANRLFAENALKKGGFEGLMKHSSGLLGGGLGAYAEGGKGGLVEFGAKRFATSGVGKKLGLDKLMEGSMGKVMGKFGGLGEGALALFKGDFKGAGKAVLKGTAAKALYAVPGIGQFAMIGDMLGFDITGKATAIVGNIAGEFIGGAKDMGKGVKQIFSGDFGAGLKSLGGGAAKLMTSPFVGIGKGIGKILGFGSGAKIESAWHPVLLQYLYSKGMKPGDKIPKDEIKTINKQLFGNEKAPGTKDGFSFYDMKGGEEKADRRRSPAESLAKSQEIAANYGTGMSAQTGQASGSAPRKMGGFRDELGRGVGNMVNTAMQSTLGTSMLGQAGLGNMRSWQDLQGLGQSVMQGGAAGEQAIIGLLTQIAQRENNVFIDGRKITDLIAQHREEMGVQ